MKRAAALLVLTSCLLGACTSTEALNTYERDELIAVKHNHDNGYTLLVYRDPLGQTRHVLRREGVYELTMTYTLEGIIELKERGSNERELEATEANRLTRRINDLLGVAPAPDGPEHAKHLSSI